MGGKDVFLHSTAAYCTKCNTNETARVVAYADGVFLERLCPKGIKRVKIAKNHQWYIERTSRPGNIRQNRTARPSVKGCPLDCGLCEQHTGSLQLPVFSITNDCNLNCPICFTYNRPDSKYHKTVKETEQIIGHLLKARDNLQLINITGGEPTLHPDLFSLLNVCRRKEIGRITMNTNGIRIANDFAFAEKIKGSGVQLVLSLDTFDPGKSKIIHGADITGLKRKALETMEKLDIPVTILHVCIKGVNDHETADIVSTMLHKPFVKSVTIQNMTFTGKNGQEFEPREHITMDEVEDLLSSKPGFAKADFFPLSEYHPLCYSVAYYAVDNSRQVSLTRVFDREFLDKISADSYVLNPENPAYAKELPFRFKDGVNRLWAEGAEDADIRILKKLIDALYPQDKTLSTEERQKIAEQYLKMVYIHPHMDEDNFDLDRICRCGDLVPDERGSMIPACSYNLLYRQKDSRFWVD